MILFWNYANSVVLNIYIMDSFNLTDGGFGGVYLKDTLIIFGFYCFK